MKAHSKANAFMALAAFCAASIGSGAWAAADEKTAKPEPIRGSDCLFFRTLYDWKDLDQNNLVIWGPGRDAYHVYLQMPLLDIKFNVQLAFVDRDRDGQLCGFSRDEIAVVDSSFPQRSPITAMKKLDAAGIAKLEEQYKVKLAKGKKKKPDAPQPETAK